MKIKDIPDTVEGVLKFQEVRRSSGWHTVCILITHMNIPCRNMAKHMYRTIPTTGKLENPPCCMSWLVSRQSFVPYSSQLLTRCCLVYLTISTLIVSGCSILLLGWRRRCSGCLQSVHLLCGTHCFQDSPPRSARLSRRTKRDYIRLISTFIQKSSIQTDIAF